MCDCCRKKETCLTSYGTSEFLYMSFRLMNAPATFQRIMGEVLKGIYFVQVYLDDVIVFLKTVDAHMKHLCVVI